MKKVKIIPHPTVQGYWTVLITDETGAGIYGCYPTYGQAVAFALTA